MAFLIVCKVALCREGCGGRGGGGEEVRSGCNVRKRYAVRGIRLATFGVLSTCAINFIWTSDGGSGSSSSGSARSAFDVVDFLNNFCYHKNF